MFWHRFWIRFGTPLASNSSFVGDLFSLDLLNRNSIDFVQKWLPKAGDANNLFPYFFAPVPQEVFRTVRSLTLVVANRGPIDFWDSDIDPIEIID